VSRRSPFQVVLTAEERRVLEARVRRRTAEQREVLRAQVVLAAAQGAENKQIAERLGIAPNTALKWRKRFFQEGLAGLADRNRSGRPRLSPRRSSLRSGRSPVNCPPCGRSR
jgi:predicted ArsR family transcriptional regulator